MDLTMTREGMSGDRDEFGDRMKAYERAETERRLDVSLPVVARIDGRSFSTFTRGMRRPFDPAMSWAMIDTMKGLVREFKPSIGYTQSDEITLVWPGVQPPAQFLFDGKLQKLTSVLASATAAFFALGIDSHFPASQGLLVRQPHFDCRIFNVPSETEAANAVLWRSMDCQKNAISMAARANFSHKELHGKVQRDMLAKLADCGVKYETYPEWFRFGTFAHRAVEEVDPATLDIPEQHRPTGPVLRTRIRTFSVALKTVENREDVVLRGAEPITLRALSSVSNEKGETK